MATFPILFPLKQDGGAVLPNFADQLLAFFNNDEAAVDLYISQLLLFLEDETQAQTFLTAVLNSGDVGLAIIALQRSQPLNSLATAFDIINSAPVVESSSPFVNELNTSYAYTVI